MTHYDLPVFPCLLGKHPVYSCGIWHPRSRLHNAQRRKLGMICSKLRLEEGERLLDIGCGRGELMLLAHYRHGAIAHGITPSRQEWKSIMLHPKKNSRIRTEQLNLIEFVPSHEFDCAAAIEVLEHFPGLEGRQAFFSKAAQCLKAEGRLVVQAIVSTTDSTLKAERPFLATEFASQGQIMEAAKERFRLEEVVNLGVSNYLRTIDCWRERLSNRTALKKYPDAVQEISIVLDTIRERFQSGELDIQLFTFTKRSNK